MTGLDLGGVLKSSCTVVDGCGNSLRLGDWLWYGADLLASRTAEGCVMPMPLATDSLGTIGLSVRIGTSGLESAMTMSFKSVALDTLDSDIDSISVALLMV